MWDRVALGLVFSRDLRFPCQHMKEDIFWDRVETFSVLIHISFGACTKGLIENRFHRDIVLSHPNNNNDVRIGVSRLRIRFRGALL